MMNDGYSTKKKRKYLPQGNISFAVNVPNMFPVISENSCFCWADDVIGYMASSISDCIRFSSGGFEFRTLVHNEYTEWMKASERKLYTDLLPDMVRKLRYSYIMSKDSLDDYQKNHVKSILRMPTTELLKEIKELLDGN